MTLGNEKILENETGCSVSHTVENLLWKRLWTRPKTECDYYFQKQRMCTHENYKSKLIISEI